MGVIERARELRKVIETNAAGMDDVSACKAMELFALWEGGGVSYTAGIRLRHQGKLYKVLQTHVSQEDWAPDVAQSLFAEVLPGQEGTETGVWKQPDSTNPYMAGDRVHYPKEDGPVYESIIDNNVWSPTDYPEGWKVV